MKCITLAGSCQKISWLILVFVHINSSVFSQDKVVTESNQQWLQYYNQTRLTDKWIIMVDGGYRWIEGFAFRSQYLVRAAAGYEVGHGITLAAGAGHWGTYTDRGVTISEFRPHQEVSYKHGGNKLAVNHRFRVEERFIKSTGKSDLEFDRFNWRFRYFIGLSFPLKTFSKHPDMALRFSIGDELLLNAGKEIVYNIFDQNRLLVGPVFQLSENLGFSLLYQGRFMAFNLPERYQYDHIFWFGIRHQLDLSKSHGTPP